MKSTDLYEFTFKIGASADKKFITVIERDLEKATKKSRDILGKGNWDLYIDKVEPTNID